MILFRELRSHTLRSNQVCMPQLLSLRHKSRVPLPQWKIPHDGNQINLKSDKMPHQAGPYWISYLNINNEYSVPLLALGEGELVPKWLRVGVDVLKLRGYV